MTQRQFLDQLRKALNVFAQDVDENTALEIAGLYSAWNPGVSYSAGEYITYGVNGVGDPQLYKVVQAHTSQDDWTPDKTQALYVAIGLDDQGYPVWVRPTGQFDAYMKDDIVDYGGELYISLIDYNVWEPTAVGSESLWAKYGA